MKQRIFALLLVVALLVTAAVVMVNAAETEKDYNEVYAKAVKMTQDGVFAEANRDAETGAVTAGCPFCGTENETWLPLEDDTATSSLTGNQHYYLPESLSRTKMSTIGTDNTQLTFCLHLNGNNITSTVRVFQIANMTVMNIMGDGVVTGGYTYDSPQRGATLDSTGWLNLCGGTYKRTSSQAVIGLRGTSGKVVDYGNGMAMYDGTIIDGGGESYTASTVYVHAPTTQNYDNKLIIAGGTIMNGCSTNGGNIYATGAKSQVNITGGTVFGGKAIKDAEDAGGNGGNIYLTTSATLNLSGGTISGGYAETNGGNVATATKAFINMLAGSNGTGGTISGGYANQAGNIYCGGTTTFKCAAGTLTGGTSRTSGYNLFVNNSNATLEISGGTIDGDLFVGAFKSFKLSGSPKINLGNQNGLYLNTTATDKYYIDISELESDALIYVSAAKDKTLTSALEDPTKIADLKDCFRGAIRTTIAADEATGTITATAGTTGYCPHCEKEVTWTALTSTGSLTCSTADTHYYLTGTLTRTHQLTVKAKGVCIDLNGKTLRKTSKNRLIALNADGASLGIISSAGGGVAQAYGTVGNGGVIYLQTANTQLDLFSGKLEHTKTDTTNYKGYTGGFIGGTASNLTVNVHGGIIAEGSSVGDATHNALGGNIGLSSSSAKVNVYGGYIQNGSVTRSDDSDAANGGNIYCGGDINITGGFIIDGTAQDNGGNIYCGGDLNVKNALITGGTASAQGNAIYVDSGTATLDDCMIDGSAAGKKVFAVYVKADEDNNGVLVLKGNTFIDNGGIGGNAVVTEYGDLTVDESFTGRVKVTIAGNHVPDPAYGKSLPQYAPKGYDQCTGAYTGTLILDDYLQVGHNYGQPKIISKYDAETKDTKLYIQGDVIALVEQDAYDDKNHNVTLYKDVDAMLAAYDSSKHYIKLGGNDKEIDLPAGEHIIDINGYPVTVTCTTGAANVSGFDSSNAENISSVNGALTVGETVTVTDELKHEALDGKEYYMLNKQGTNTYTYHYVTLKLASVSLRTREVGIYYTAEIKADSRFRDAVAEYGIVVRLDEAPTKDFATETLTGWSIYEGPAVSGTVYGTMVSGIMKDIEGRDAAQNQANGERPIFAAAYITLAGEYGGETAISETANYSLKSFMDALDANTKLLATKITNSQGEVVCTYEDKLDEFYTAWQGKGMSDWTFNNINVVEEAEPEA